MPKPARSAGLPFRADSGRMLRVDPRSEGVGEGRSERFVLASGLLVGCIYGGPEGWMYTIRDGGGMWLAPIPIDSELNALVALAGLL
mgnify:FL=1